MGFLKVSQGEAEPTSEVMVPYILLSSAAKAAYTSRKTADETSGQDGGVGRYTVPPCTTKRRTNLKTKSNQNCQKIELYGSPTTKELKKKHSSRWVGGGEMGNWAERTLGRVAAGGPEWARLQLAG